MVLDAVGASQVVSACSAPRQAKQHLSCQAGWSASTWVLHDWAVSQFGDPASSKKHLRAGRDGMIVKVHGGRGLLEKKCHVVR